MGACARPVRWTPVSLTIGIVGLPNVGKSTLFNALTKNDVLAANYPFATIEPNVGVVGVPDPRLDKLAEIFGSQKIIPATVSFVDIAGIVRGASEGAGLGNKFLANIRESDAICQVIRVFTDPDVVHVDGKVSPADDIETINTELLLADLQTLEKAIPRLEKEMRKDKERASLHAAAVEAQKVLNEGRTLFSAGIDPAPLRELGLMTTKPFLYVFNVDEEELGNEELIAELRGMVAPAEAILMDAKIESELAELPADEAAELLAGIGQEEPGLDQLAGVIHTDFQRGFIKAEIVSFDQLVEAGSMAEAKGKGWVRMEGKEYVMQDGDVVEFRFNV